SFASLANGPTPPLVLYFMKASWFLTDLTPGTPRAISEALALASMVATWPVNVTTPASVRTSTFLSCESFARRVSTAFAMSLSLASTACRAAGVTTWRSFFTDFTPSTPCAMSLAALLASAESTLPRRWTTPLAASTLTGVPFTRSSAKREILVLEVTQLSVTLRPPAAVRPSPWRLQTDRRPPRNWNTKTTAAPTSRRWTNPPPVYELPMPSAHSTKRTTATVHSMTPSFFSTVL